jgi:hypothetical protein
MIINTPPFQFLIKEKMRMVPISHAKSMIINTPTNQGIKQPIGLASGCSAISSPPLPQPVILPIRSLLPQVSGPLSTSAELFVTLEICGLELLRGTTVVQSRHGEGEHGEEHAHSQCDSWFSSASSLECRPASGHLERGDVLRHKDHHVV